MEMIDFIQEIEKEEKCSTLPQFPDDWCVFTIQNLLEKKYILGHLDGNHGEQYPRSDEFKEYGIPYISANDFLNGFVDFSRCKFLSETKAKLFKKGVARDGDVLFAHNATVGPVALLKTNLDFVILSTTATYFRCNEVWLCNVFLEYALQAPFFVKQYQAVMAQSTRFQVPITTQRKLSLMLPSLLEQTTIATALSDIDALITSLDKLIAKKRDIKQATMQQLLTGKTRLPGFSGEWVVKKLGERCEFYSGGTPNTSNSEFYGGGISWITSSDLNMGRIKEVEGRITKLGFESSSVQMVKKGTLLLALYGATAGVTAITEVDAAINQAVLAIIPQKDDSEFLFQKLILLKDWLIKTYTQGGQPNLSGQIVKLIELSLPSKIEQQAIATALSDMDAEIAALEQKREKTRMLKQGMMQELLTGKIRLV